MRISDIAIRIALAMLIGGIIGWQRESIHRPAGLRTHMLVSVGASIAMLIGQYSFYEFYEIANVDPVRMAAQVISGVGFLGAGTIMKEGANVTGLTTAASIWAVACLGLAAGAGFYPIATIGLVAIFLTLTIFEQLQKHFNNGKGTRLFVEMKCINTSQVLLNINRLAQQYYIEIKDIKISDNEYECSKLEFKMYFSKGRSSINYTRLIAEIGIIKGVLDLKTEEY